HSPSIVARPSISRPSSRKKSIVPPRSSTTIPTLSIRLSAMCPIYKVPSSLTTDPFLQRQSTSDVEPAWITHLRGGSQCLHSYWKRHRHISACSFPLHRCTA